MDMIQKNTDQIVIVLLDLQMPLKSGYDVLSEKKAMKL
jgi:DNA-binding response OmpR family regulator